MILEQEKPNKFFFDQEKQKQKTMKQLETIENDKIITLTNDLQILNYCKNFFSDFTPNYKQMPKYKKNY